MERERIFIDYITGKIYRLLVLREARESGEENYLDEFISRLFVEINGAHLWSDFFRQNEGFTVVTSTIAYLANNETPFKMFRKEVLNSLKVLNKVREECVVNNDGLGTL